jgi:hypothetical protein
VPVIPYTSAMFHPRLFHVNDGLDEVFDPTWAITSLSVTCTFSVHHISFLAAFQVAVTGSVHKCTGGPHLSFLAVRSSPTQAAPDGPIRDLADSIDLNQDKGRGFLLVDLLVSRSTGFSGSGMITLTFDALACTDISLLVHSLHSFRRHQSGIRDSVLF